jgi:nitroreductase
MLIRSKYDVGVLGWWYGNNYGSMLTYFALQKALKNFDLKPVMIHETLGYNAYRVRWGKDIPPMEFARRQNYAQTEQIHLKNIGALNRLSDTFLVGSDQVWNPLIGRVNDDLFLNFTTDTKKRIAYAASFGNANEDKFNPDFLARNIPNLQRFDAISVREEYAVKLAEEIFGVAATHVVDPVFLLERAEYESLADQATMHVEGDFLFAFILDPTPAKKSAILATLTKFGLAQAVIITDAHPSAIERAKALFSEEVFRVIDDIKPENYLRAYQRATYVVTDSFHGSCFSCIFQKPFSVFYNTKRGADRFTALMKLLDIGDSRRLNETDTLETIRDNPNVSLEMNYHAASCRATDLRSKSLQWLGDSLRAPKNPDRILPAGERYPAIRWNLLAGPFSFYEGESTYPLCTKVTFKDNGHVLNTPDPIGLWAIRNGALNFYDKQHQLLFTSSDPLNAASKAPDRIKLVAANQPKSCSPLFMAPTPSVAAGNAAGSPSANASPGSDVPAPAPSDNLDSTMQEQHVLERPTFIAGNAAWRVSAGDSSTQLMVASREQASRGNLVWCDLPKTLRSGNAYEMTLNWKFRTTAKSINVHLRNPLTATFRVVGTVPVEKRVNSPRSDKLTFIVPGDGFSQIMFGAIHFTGADGGAEVAAIALRRIPRGEVKPRSAPTAKKHPQKDPILVVNEFSGTDNDRYLKSYARNMVSRNLGNARAVMMWYSHGFEKGLSRSKDFRPGFGKATMPLIAAEMDKWIATGQSAEDPFFRIAASTMRAYFDRHSKLEVDVSQFWSLFSPRIQSEISKADPSIGGVFAAKSLRESVPDGLPVRPFLDIVFSRRSVREFTTQRVADHDVRRAVEIAIQAPSVCNRQSWRVRQFDNTKTMQAALDQQGGFRGYKMPPKLLLVTSDLTAFVMAVERNQAFIDGGIFLMLLLLGLEQVGLGACPLNTAMSKEREAAARRILKIPDSEVFIAFVAVGHHDPKVLVPISKRLPVEQVLLEQASRPQALTSWLRKLSAIARGSDAGQSGVSSS